MTTNPLARNGGLSYLHVHAESAERCARFYEAVAGWAVERRANGGWRFASPDGLLIGGFGDDGSGARPGASFVPYVFVTDVDAAVGVATKRGGSVVRAPYDENDLRLARVRDTEGNELGLWRFR